MLMRAAHNCKTTFVGGMNPFIPAAAFAPVPDPTPQEPKKPKLTGRPPILQSQIFALLADRKPRTAREISLDIDRRHKSVEHVLWHLAKVGMLSSTMKKRECIRPVPVYSLWGTE